MNADNKELFENYLQTKKELSDISSQESELKLKKKEVTEQHKNYEQQLIVSGIIDETDEIEIVEIPTEKTISNIVISKHLLSFILKNDLIEDLNEYLIASHPSTKLQLTIDGKWKYDKPKSFEKKIVIKE